MLRKQLVYWNEGGGQNEQIIPESDHANFHIPEKPDKNPRAQQCFAVFYFS